MLIRTQIMRLQHLHYDLHAQLNDSHAVQASHPIPCGWPSSTLVQAGWQQELACCGLARLAQAGCSACACSSCTAVAELAEHSSQRCRAVRLRQSGSVQHGSEVIVYLPSFHALWSGSCFSSQPCTACSIMHDMLQGKLSCSTPVARPVHACMHAAPPHPAAGRPGGDSTLCLHAHAHVPRVLPHLHLRCTLLAQQPARWCPPAWSYRTAWAAPCRVAWRHRWPGCGPPAGAGVPQPWRARQSLGKARKGMPRVRM